MDGKIWRLKWQKMTVDDNCLLVQWRLTCIRWKRGSLRLRRCHVDRWCSWGLQDYDLGRQRVETQFKRCKAPDPVERGAWVLQGWRESTLKNHVVSFHHVLHRVWGPTGKACVMRVRNGISSTSKKDVFSSGNNSIMDFNSCQNFHGLCFKEGQVVQCKYVIGERSGKGEGGAHTSRICISSPTYHAH